MANLTHVELITPERVLFSGEAEAVVMRTDGGDITFLANHMDYIAAVDICVVRIQGVQRSACRPAKAVARLDASRGRGRKRRARLGERSARRRARWLRHGGRQQGDDRRRESPSSPRRSTSPAPSAPWRAPRAAGGDRPVGQPSPPRLAEQGACALVSERVAAEAAAARARARLQAAAQLKANLSHM